MLGGVVLDGFEPLSGFVREQLSPGRFAHTQGVVEAAARLSRRFGESEERAVAAAWIHDAAREWPEDRLQQAAERIEVPPGFASIPVLLHGPIAADMLINRFDCQDLEMADAVRFHTTGRPGMTRLEKIICLADAIEPGRAYPGVERLRELAEQDLDLALAESLDGVMRYLLDRHQPIFTLTVMARNDLWENLRHRQAGLPSSSYSGS